MELPLPSKGASETIKGIAILAIMAHNFYHHLPPVMGENEFSFDPELFGRYLSALRADPQNVLRYLFSYFGHLGVQIFVFFTACGYAVKCRSGSAVTMRLLMQRFLRIYITFLLAVVIYMVLIWSSWKFGFGAKPVAFWDVVARIGLVSNLLPFQALAVVGPWWYVSFLLQVMICLPLIIVLYRHFGPVTIVAAIVVNVLLQWLINPYLIVRGLNINHTVFGHLIVLFLGVGIAHEDLKDISVWWLIAAVLVLALSNFNVWAWFVYGGALIVVILAIYGAATMRRSKQGVLATFLAYFGSISLYLFLVNGFLRLPFRTVSTRFDSALVDVILATCFVGVSLPVALLLKRLEGLVLEKTVQLFPRLRI